LPKNAAVTRFAPSPTGFLHIGGLFGALADLLTARRDGGVFILRLEDTDKKREVAGGAAAITQGLQAFGLTPDEGLISETEERGDYGPYVQSRRREIYHTVAKTLVEKELAYPCFCGAADLEQIHAAQTAAGVNTGYYGHYARCRNLPLQEQLRRIAAGQPYVLRLRATPKGERVTFRDTARGTLTFPENDRDDVIIKSDGLPPYHFAACCDDHFMRVTHVIRGDEWLASLPLHLNLCAACGFTPPRYAHTAPILTLDEITGGKRKISKRKDPEAATQYFSEAGYPAAAVPEYLLTILDSSFEAWRRGRPDAALTDFPFDLKKLAVSGALFDKAKLEDVAKTVVARMDAEEVYARCAAWARDYDPDFFALFTRDPAYTTAFLSIGRGGKKPRKDIARWDQMRETWSYMFDELYRPAVLEAPEALPILRAFAAREDFDFADFERIRAICAPLGYCADMGEYKRDPAAYKGSVTQVSTTVRLAVTGRENSPDLSAILRVLGKKRGMARIQQHFS
jgi:glutamyl-tRNA synthetase